MTLPPGNRGTVDFGETNNSTADISRQILYGLNDDDWAALAAALVSVTNAALLLGPAIAGLMDKRPGAELLERISAAARTTPDVRHIEKLKVRKAGLQYFVDIHVQADPGLSLHDAHILSGRVKTAIRASVPEVAGVLIHMEPHEV